MPHRNLKVVASTVLLCAGVVSSSWSVPPFQFADEGRTFVYRARPGEAPATVAEGFGVPEEGLPAFLVATGIRDATRVPRGFEYRMPNPLGARLDTVETERERLDRDLRARTARVAELERSLAEVRTQAAFSAAKERRLANLEARWPIGVATLVVALLGLVGALWTAHLAVRRLAGAERHAHALAHELEARRRTDLVARQEADRRVIELEGRLRQLEHEPPRLVTAGS
jgi:hypothetical protein